MSEHENEALIRRLAAEVWNKGELAFLDEVYAPDAHTQSREAFARVVTTLRAGMPDLEMTIQEMVSAADAVTVRWTIRGTHTGRFPALSAADVLNGAHRGEDHPGWLLDFAASHKPVRFEGVSLFRMRAGRIVSSWVLVDRLGLLRQLGALPVLAGMTA
jgi:predicted ester cyclase